MTVRTTTQNLVETLSLLLARRGMPPVGYRANDLTVFGVRNTDPSNRFNDVIGVARRRVSGGPVHLLLNGGTVDPGRAALRNPMNPRGVFRMAVGRNARIWTPGYHHQDPARPALVQVPNSKIIGFRDNDRDDVFEQILAVDNPSGINLHDGWTGLRDQPVDHFSHGCWVTQAAFVREILACVEEQAKAGMGRIVSSHLWDLDADPEAGLLLAAVGMAA